MRAEARRSLFAPPDGPPVGRPELEGYIFPSKLYGILAAGRPVVFVGDPQGEIAVLVKREGIGVAVRQGDAAGLADQLLRLAGDAAMREAMGRRARALHSRGRWYGRSPFFLAVNTDGEGLESECSPGKGEDPRTCGIRCAKVEVLSTTERSGGPA